jgi:hypothetical protein
MTAPRWRLPVVAVLSAAWVTPTPSLADPPQVADSTPSLLAAHCVECHGADDAQASFRVDTLTRTIDTIEMAERWQKVLNALNSGEMPPREGKPLEPAAKIELLDDLSHAMVRARRSLADQGGGATLRRLNRREYRNTLRQLLGVDVDVNELPADTRPGGFDTSGSNLFMSGDQFDQYRALGRDAVHEAFLKQAAVGVEKKLRVEAEAGHAAFVAANKKWHDEHRRAKEWCDAVLDAAKLPDNAETLAELRKRAPSDWQLVHQWKRIPGAPPPSQFGWPADADEQVLWELNVNVEFIEYEKRYLEQPLLDSGAYLTLPGANRSSYANNWFSLQIPADWPPGDYVVRIRAGATPQAVAERRFVEFGQAPWPRDVPAISTHAVLGTLDAPAVIEIPYTVLAKHDARSRAIFIRERDAGQLPRAVARFKEAQKANGRGPELATWVDWIEVERKSDASQDVPPGIRALEIPLDDRGVTIPAGAIKAALGRFVLEAYRGASAPKGYLDRLVADYGFRRKAGATHMSALEETLASVLSSPRFLYHAETTVEDGGHLDGQKVASRLSYLLWGEPPDAILRQKAKGKTLIDARSPDQAVPDQASLEQQCRRLLDDPRSMGFVEPFVSQWLSMDRLDFFQFSHVLYPRFDAAAKEAARCEVYETFADLLRTNGRLGDLLKSDSVVVNSLLAGYYGIDDVVGDEFRRVPVPQGNPRGGLLGMAAIHAMGSDGEHTSPVERGVWVLRKLLDDPPPPAPPNVPQVARLAGKSLTTAERLVAHQEEPQCASCHRRIDPPGLALENFDAVGRWRAEDSYTPLDANGWANPALKKTWVIEVNGSFHGGPSYVGFEGFRAAVAARERDFARGFTKALVEYAFGRPCGFRDEPLVESIVARAEAKNFAMREFIFALVQSEAFRSKCR